MLRVPGVVQAVVLVLCIVILSIYSIEVIRGTSDKVFGPYFRSTGATTSLASRGPRRLPMVGSLDRIPATPSNHPADTHGQFVMKKVMIPNGKVPNLTGFSRAVVKPQQMIQRHSHATMDEVFYVEQGRAIFLIDEDHHVIEKGGFVHIPAGEPHSILNLANGNEERPEDRDLVLLYFGVANDE